MLLLLVFLFVRSVDVCENSFVMRRVRVSTQCILFIERSTHKHTNICTLTGTYTPNAAHGFFFNFFCFSFHSSSQYIRTYAHAHHVKTIVATFMRIVCFASVLFFSFSLWNSDWWLSFSAHKIDGSSFILSIMQLIIVFNVHKSILLPLLSEEVVRWRCFIQQMNAHHWKSMVIVKQIMIEWNDSLLINKFCLHQVNKVQREEKTSCLHQKVANKRNSSKVTHWLLSQLNRRANF